LAEGWVCFICITTCELSVESGKLSASLREKLVSLR